MSEQFVCPLETTECNQLMAKWFDHSSTSHA